MKTSTPSGGAGLMSQLHRRLRQEACKMEASLGYSVLQKEKKVKRELGLYHSGKTHIQYTRDPGFNPLITQTEKKRVKEKKKGREEGKEGENQNIFLLTT